MGPGGVGEGTPLAPPFMHLLTSRGNPEGDGPGLRHLQLSLLRSRLKPVRRCLGSAVGTTQEAALIGGLAFARRSAEAFYAALRDHYEPGKPIWNSETGQAACGGDRWAATFLDTFRYLNQLGSLARAGVQVQMHNTLNASDYGLLDEKTWSHGPTTGPRCCGEG